MLRQGFAGRLQDVLGHRSPRAGSAVRAVVNGYYSRVPAARRRTFTRIYETNHWGDDRSRSGGGSNLAETAAVRAALPDLFARRGIASLLDIPCGDFFWMQHVADHLDHYTGGDIVPALVEEVRDRHGAACRTFLQLDLVTDALPRADAVLARDVLIHFSEADVRRALANVRASGAQWLLTTTYPQHVNRDIVTGDWRPINLEAPPYDLPAPVELIDEMTSDPRFADRALALWRTADLPDR